MNESKKIALEKIEVAKINESYYLDLSGLDLYSIPKEIGQLISLVDLDLSYNHLMTLPHEINNLTSLRYLNLSNNSFNHLNGIGFDEFNQVPLKGLNLSNNYFSKIPDDIYFLKNLEDININNNPVISDVPERILDQEFDVIDEYLKEVQRHKFTTKLYEAKLILIGQGEVGKTTLMKKLINNNFIVEKGSEESTHGVNINKWEINKESNKDDEIEDEEGYDEYGDYYDNYYEEFYFLDNHHEYPILNMWDFGGQEIYYSTHQYFLTKRSIYVFVWDARKEEEYGSFDYWFNIVKLLGKESPLIVVMNKSDERIKYIDENSLKKKFENISSFHQVSCLTGDGIEELRGEIINTVRTLSHIGKRVPKMWTDIKFELEQLNENYITYERYISICKEYNALRSTAKFFADYYHDLGIIINYSDDPILKNIVIINPEWATTAFYKLIDNQEIQKNQGRFSYQDLSKVWDKKTYSTNIYNELIRLMKKFEICFNLVGTDEYILPELLKHDNNIDIENFINKSELKFEYRLKFMPAGILPRFICRVFIWIKKNAFWKSGVVLDYEDSSALILVDKVENVLKIFIYGEDKVQLLGIIKKEFITIFESLKLEKDKDYRELLPCICSSCRNNSLPHFFNFTTIKKYRLKDKKLITCPRSIEDVEIKTITKGYQKTTIQENLFYQIIKACASLQGNHKNIDNKENSRNGYITSLLNYSTDFTPKDQSLWGKSPTNKSQGELDIKIENQEGIPVSIFEGMNLQGVNRSKISEHLRKIFDYDPNGLKGNYLVTYSSDNDFLSFWTKYKKYIIEVEVGYPLIHNFEDISDKYSYGNKLKIGKTTYKVEGSESYIYHFFLNMKY